MHSFNFASLSLDELKEVKLDLDKHIADQVAVKRAALLKELRELEEIGTKSEPRAKTSHKTYIGPNGKTWKGRGPKPAWLREFEEKGGNLAELII
ncbi:H-NS histone family protein [Rhizobium sp. NFR07]|uniref:H-NS family nucleoid-associated regulatory protein n=1 Tax=Rhizobium sp. NFR07 TaxID=1566262 RepID=UPI0008E4163A|nr:H-NS family nucleoid-associated regulatory protein [Rhizobium sp. NFR07]SFB52093.1 H-NS histone family protein [Rhizobium sp. NFR07]